MLIPDEQIVAMKKRVEAATPGPWTTEKPQRNPEGWSQGVLIAAVGRNQGIYANPPGGQFPEFDRQFIAHARQDIPALLSEREERVTAQDVLTKWAAECFGDDQVNSPEIRGLRLAEESIEFSQAVSVPAEKLHALIDYVYARPAGQPAQELGGVAVTALVAASSIGVRFDECLAMEQARVLAKPREHFAARNKAKVDAGFTDSVSQGRKE